MIDFEWSLEPESPDGTGSNRKKKTFAFLFRVDVSQVILEVAVVEFRDHKHVGNVFFVAFKDVATLHYALREIRSRFQSYASFSRSSSWMSCLVPSMTRPECS